MDKFLMRCQDCDECIKKGKNLVCHEMWDKEIHSLDECPLGIEFEEMEKVEEINKTFKVDHGAKAETKKERKKPSRPLDEVKIQFIKDLAEFLEDYGMENVSIANPSKLITFTSGKDTFKLDLIRQRKKKK